MVLGAFDMKSHTPIAECRHVSWVIESYLIKLHLKDKVGMELYVDLMGWMKIGHGECITLHFKIMV